MDHTLVTPAILDHLKTAQSNVVGIHYALYAKGVLCLTLAVPSFRCVITFVSKGHSPALQNFLAGEKYLKVGVHLERLLGFLVAKHGYQMNCFWELNPISDCQVPRLPTRGFTNSLKRCLQHWDLLSIRGIFVTRRSGLLVYNWMLWPQRSESQAPYRQRWHSTSALMSPNVQSGEWTTRTSKPEYMRISLSLLSWKLWLYWPLHQSNGMFMFPITLWIILKLRLWLQNQKSKCDKNSSRTPFARLVAVGPC